jgi:hypothetical protein
MRKSQPHFEYSSAMVKKFAHTSRFEQSAMWSFSF